MGAVRECHIYCNDCLDRFGITKESITAARWSAKHFGWHFNGFKDICPSCWDKRHPDHKAATQKSEKEAGAGGE